MTTLQEFLVEHANFPFPQLVDRPFDATDISDFEVGLLTQEWRAQKAVRDETLIPKLCHTLKDILGDTLLPEDIKDHLLLSFGHHLQFPTIGTMNEDPDWSIIGGERDCERLLNKGFFQAARVCLHLCGEHGFATNAMTHIEGGQEWVDYYVASASASGKSSILVEAKSPSVMKRVGDSLPVHGFKLNWAHDQPLVPTILQRAALHLGLRKMEWLFLTCHNYWIVCRLVRDNDHPFLAYSSICSIKDSSEPFLAFFGAILSVLKDVPVQATISNPNMELDVFLEEQGPLPEAVSDDSSRTSISSSKVSTTHSHMTTSQAAESELMITSSSPHSPESFQVWVHLHSLPNKTFVLPQCAQNRNGKQWLWLTHLTGFDLTGNASVWQCHFDNSDSLFAIKVVELLHGSYEDKEWCQQLENEFEGYLLLERAYQSGQLCNQITPHCYGAFKGNRVHVLILELCDDGTLNTWDELNISERTQVYGLVCDLHRVGITLDDLGPRNIAHAPGGGFRLIDFSQSRRHTCVEFSNKLDEPLSTQVPRYCYGLQAMRNVLRPFQTLIPAKPNQNLGGLQGPA